MKRLLVCVGARHALPSATTPASISAATSASLMPQLLLQDRLRVAAGPVGAALHLDLGA